MPVEKEKRVVLSDTRVQVSACVTMLCLKLIVLFVLAGLMNCEDPPEVFAVIYEWSKLDFTWSDDTAKAKFLDSAQYIPENTTISGVKLWNDRIFLTLPRWRRGVPATLASIPHPDSTTSRDPSPKLEPFPSWEMQQVGNCTALQNVQNIEIHPNGQMWVIDSGRVNTLSERSDDRCPPKLVIFDINTMSSSSSSGFVPYDANQEHGSGRSYNSQSGYNNEAGYNPQSGSNNDDNSQYGYTQRGYTTPGTGTYSYHHSSSGAKIVRTFVFSDPVISLDSYLVDIVLDTPNGEYAYISDASESDPGIIVYNWKENRAWKVRDNRSMRADPGIRTLTINGMYVTINRNIAGIALSPISLREEQRRLFYSPLSSYSLFSIPTSILKDEFRSSTDVSGSIKTLGRRTSITEGMAIDSNGILYYGLLGENAISRWDTNLPFEGNQRMIARDNISLQWPASFGFDSDRGNITVVSNRLQNFLAGKVNLNEANYRIITAYTGARSYLYPPSGVTQTTPKSTTMSTQMTDRTYNTERSYNDQGDMMDHSQHHHITEDRTKGNNGEERLVPGMTILLLALAKLVVA